MASFVRAGSQYINLDAVQSVHTGVRAQHPDRTRPASRQYVDDAVCVRFGQSEEQAILLFDAEARALLAAVGSRATATKAPSSARK